MRTGTILALISALTLLTAVQARAQKVYDADFRQEGNKVIVTFRLDRQADIDLYVSTDGGRTFKGPLRKVSGDAGRMVSPGECRITWDPLEEFGGISGSRICFKIKAGKSTTATSSRASCSTKRMSREPFVRFGAGAGVGTMTLGKESVLTWHVPVEILFGRDRNRINASIGETFSFFKNTVQFSTIAVLKVNFAKILYLGAGGGFNANVYLEEEGFLEEYSDDYFDSDDFEDHLDDYIGRESLLPGLTALIYAEGGLRVGGFDLSIFYKYDFYRMPGFSLPGTFGGTLKYYF